MAAILQTNFSNTFLCVKIVVLLIKILLKFIPIQDPITNIAALISIMAWNRTGDKPLSWAMWPSLMTPICVTRPLHGEWKDHIVEWWAYKHTCKNRRDTDCIMHINVPDYDHVDWINWPIINNEMIGFSSLKLSIQICCVFHLFL